jgi:hypothetical protein
LLVSVDDRSENPFDATQILSLDEPLAPALHEPVSPEAVAKFAARSAHHTRIIGDKPSKEHKSNHQNCAWVEQLGKRPYVMEQNQYPVSDCRKPLWR